MKQAHAETPASVSQALFDVNVVGVLHTLKHAVMAFEKRGGGTIAFTSSIAALCGSKVAAATNEFGLPSGSHIAYCATKRAVDCIAENAHGTYHASGVNVYGLNVCEFLSEMGGRLGFIEAEEQVMLAW